jgi:chromate transporter
MNILLDLFLTFARIGGFTFGGGYAMLPIIQKEIVEKKKWATDDEVLNYYAIGQSTPGVIAVNVATFIGYKKKGIPGAIVATLGVIIIPVIIITIIAAFVRNFLRYDIVAHALSGINVAVAVLIVSAVIGLWKKGVKKLFGISLFALGFGVSVFTDWSPVVVVVAAIILGILYGSIEAGKAGKSK